MYEYCIIDNYEEKYLDHKIHIIQFSQVFIKFINVEKDKKILSINLPKEIFNIEELRNWIIDNNIEIFDNKEGQVKDVVDIKEGIKFQDNTILLYRKGIRDLPIDRSQLLAIKDNLFSQEDRRNIFYSKKMEPYKTKLDIVLYGEEIDYIPEIELCSGDLLFCNDLFIDAKYIGNYDNQIGFFKDRTYKEPVAWIFNTDETIHIRLESFDDSRVLFVEYETTELSY